MDKPCWIRRCSAMLVERSPVEMTLLQAQELAEALWEDCRGLLPPETAAWVEIDSWPGDEPAGRSPE